jgi:hypothetical protein
MKVRKVRRVLRTLALAISFNRMGPCGRCVISVGGLAAIGLPAITGGVAAPATPDILIFSTIAGFFSALTIIGAPIAALIL